MSEELNPEEYFDFLINTGAIYEIIGCTEDSIKCWELAVKLR